MIGERQVQEIIAQYEKHGWNLRRVLLSAETAKDFSATFFGDAEIVSSSELDALWFSRAAAEERETWELRHLSSNPFALVEVFEADDEEEVREEIRRELETRLAVQASKPGRKKPPVGN